MKLKRLTAAVFAVSVAAASITLSASAAAPDKVAVLGFGDSDWKVSIWGKDDDTIDYNDYELVAEITGNGDYEVTVDLSAGYTNPDWVDEETGEETLFDTANGVGAMGINVWGLPESAGLDITAVIVDGGEMPLQGASYTNDEDGGKRTNVYNPWTEFNEDADLTRNAGTATAQIVDLSNIGEWTMCTVRFTVYGMNGEVPAEPPANAKPPEKPANPENPTSPVKTGRQEIAVMGALAIISGGLIIASRRGKD